MVYGPLISWASHAGTSCSLGGQPTIVGAGQCGRSPSAGLVCSAHAGTIRHAAGRRCAGQGNPRSRGDDADYTIPLAFDLGEPPLARGRHLLSWVFIGRRPGFSLGVRGMGPGCWPGGPGEWSLLRQGTGALWAVGSLWDRACGGRVGTPCGADGGSPWPGAAAGWEEASVGLRRRLDVAARYEKQIGAGRGLRCSPLNWGCRGAEACSAGGRLRRSRWRMTRRSRSCGLRGSSR